MATHRPLHLGTTTEHLPDVNTDFRRRRDESQNTAHAFVRETVMQSSVQRRNPYGINPRVGFVGSEEADDVISRTSRSSSSRHTAAEGSGSQNIITQQIKSPAYSSYRHGTRSIAKSKNANAPFKSPARQFHGYGQNQVHPFLVASPQLDSAPDAAMTHTVASNLIRQGQRLVHDVQGASERRMNILLFIPVFIIFVLSAPSIMEPILKGDEWQWTPDRRLDDRQCVMNLFIERQPPDEFDPDFVKPPEDDDEDKESKTNFKQPLPKIAEGTYRTEGQMKVITRLIESVANSFRSNIEVKQHIIFTGARDGGQLAEMAKKHWPPRGSHRTQLHVVAADHSQDIKLYKNKVLDGVVLEDPLEYGFLEAIEKRFQGHKEVHLYDRYGAAAVSLNPEMDDYYEADDDEAEGFSWSRNLQAVDEEAALEEGESIEKIDSNSTEVQNENEEAGEELEAVEVEVDVAREPYIDLETLIPRDEEDIIVPYMHVDGINMAAQMEILESARPLMEDNTIVAIGVEHSHDMDVYALIDFFNSANYKTFFLGSRQIARIDHLCPEILDDVIRHPSISPPSLTRTAKWLKKLGLYTTDIKSEEDQMHKYPPFFVAMPRGRLSKEEMTIQHMYDLFGGYDGGGGQVQTANDRKAPGQK